MPVGLPVIPETFTVHLGAPDQPAQNVTLPFMDYIMNVASSEIYPTWPEEAIRANVYAQISFALNRIYTEYYRARGYDFDITSSTSIDQSFVEGRDIFENIHARGNIRYRCGSGQRRSVRTCWREWRFRARWGRSRWTRRLLRNQEKAG